MAMKVKDVENGKADGGRRLQRQQRRERQRRLQGGRGGGGDGRAFFQ